MINPKAKATLLGSCFVLENSRKDYVICHKPFIDPQWGHPGVSAAPRETQKGTENVEVK